MNNFLLYFELGMVKTLHKSRKIQSKVMTKHKSVKQAVKHA